MAKTQLRVVINDSKSWRDFLIQQMIGVANETVPAQTAKAICALSQQVYNTLKIEIAAASLKARLSASAIPIANFDREGEK